MKKTDVVRSTKYITHLIKLIESKRQLSINEMNKSYLTTTNQLSEINAWYQNIIKCIKRSPPDNYVAYLTLFQDSVGHFYKVEYHYVNNDLPSEMIEFIIIPWNDTK